MAKVMKSIVRRKVSSRSQLCLMMVKDNNSSNNNNSNVKRMYCNGSAYILAWRQLHMKRQILLSL